MDFKAHKKACINMQFSAYAFRGIDKSNIHVIIKCATECPPELLF